MWINSYPSFFNSIAPHLFILSLLIETTVGQVALCCIVLATRGLEQLFTTPLHKRMCLYSFKDTVALNRLGALLTDRDLVQHLMHLFLSTAPYSGYQ